MDIQRTSSPQSTPKHYRLWSALLNAQPPYEWARYFWQHNATAAFNARGVEIRGGTVSFVSDESNVGQWIKHIDEWIAKTNHWYASELRAGEHQTESVPCETSGQRIR
jgi:hypothetical protein